MPQGVKVQVLSSPPCFYAMKNQSDNILPNMMGTEHELSLLFNYRASSEVDDVRDINSILQSQEESLDSSSLYQVPSLLDEVIWENDFGNQKILKNGGVFQEFQIGPLEIATPECSKPAELLSYSLAAREQVCNWTQFLVQNNSDTLRSVSLHERVVDSCGNTWGEHDNYSLNSSECHWSDDPDNIPRLIWLHALTRGCVSGAGHVNGQVNGWSLSQKLPTVSDINGKKWGSTGLFCNDERLEIRCSDKNISQWSHLIRIGSMALVMALERSGFDIEGIGFKDSEIEKKSNIGTFDKLLVNSKGDVKFSHDAKIAVSVQKALAEACMLLVEKEGMDDEYKSIARSWYSHCENLDKEVFSGSSIQLDKFLHTDWASKFYLIQKKYTNDLENGTIRIPFDYQAQAQDLYYDRILFDAPVAKGKIYRVEGYGYNFNKRLKQRNIIAASAIKNAMANAPQSTRAGERITLLNELNDNKHKVENVRWNMVQWTESDQSTYKHYFQDYNN